MKQQNTVNQEQSSARKLIEDIVTEYCDGTWLGLNESSNFVWNANPMELVERLERAFCGIPVNEVKQEEVKFKKLSEWIVVEGYYAVRIKNGGDVMKIDDRVAVIEKTPRVRVDRYKIGIESNEHVRITVPKHDAWLMGSKGSDCFDEESRNWCDTMLKMLGWEVA